MFANYMFNKVAPEATCFAYLLETGYTQSELKALTHQQVLASGKVLAWGTMDCSTFGFIGHRSQTSAYGITNKAAIDASGNISARLRNGKIGWCLVAISSDGDAFVRSVMFENNELSLSRNYVSVDDTSLDIVFTAGNKPTVT